jgi:hypothetical protein
MRTVQFQPSSLQALFDRQQIATMEELKNALGTDVNMTVLRKLRPLGYLSSYSHGGRFYALKQDVRFDRRGLYRVDDVHFSRFGSLVTTAEHFVVDSPAGYFTAELNRELAVETKETLLTLVQRQRVARERVDGLYLYCAPDAQRRRAQLRKREEGIELPGSGTPRAGPEISEAAKAALVLFFSTLDERQRRLYAGMESLRLGHGGDRRIAELTGLDVHTVARGRRELFASDLDTQAVRSAGGGRPPVEKKRRR